MCADEVVLELEAQPLAELDSLGRDRVGLWQIGKEKQHAQRIVQISECVDEGRIPLLDDMVEGQTRREVLLQARRITDFIPAKSAGNLLAESFVVAELVEKGFVKKVLDVFCVVESGGRVRVLCRLALVARFTRVDSLFMSESLRNHISVPVHTLEDT